MMTTRIALIFCSTAVILGGMATTCAVVAETRPHDCPTGFIWHAYPVEGPSMGTAEGCVKP